MYTAWLTVAIPAAMSRVSPVAVAFSIYQLPAKGRLLATDLLVVPAQDLVRSVQQRHIRAELMEDSGELVGRCSVRNPRYRRVPPPSTQTSVGALWRPKHQ
jgi:hypothetical protein